VAGIISFKGVKVSKKGKGMSGIKVVIVGAGPAGLITGLNLMETGIYPLILEKQPNIKSTACGEACDI